MKNRPYRYLAVVAIALAAFTLKNLLGLDAYPFALLYWVIVAGGWADGWRGGLFAMGMAIAGGVFSGASLYRAAWFAAEGFSIVVLMAQLRQRAIATALMRKQGLLKDDFFERSSHAMKGRLANMQLAVNALKRKGSPNIELAILEQECDRLTNLVANVLKVQRLSLMPAAAKLEWIDLPHWLNGQVQAIAPLAEHRNITIWADSPELEICSDPTILEEIISELLLNAVKYSPRGGDVSLEGKDEPLAIAVVSSGAIPEDELDKVFQRFWRSGNTQAGSGLGLAIAQQQAELIGAHLTAASNDGQTTFTLRLPNARFKRNS